MTNPDLHWKESRNKIYETLGIHKDAIDKMTYVAIMSKQYRECDMDDSGVLGSHIIRFPSFLLATDAFGLFLTIELILSQTLRNLSC